MRILTVRQPWAWAIIHGQKDVENRGRNIAGAYRGTVAIHAGLKVDQGWIFTPAGNLVNGWTASRSSLTLWQALGAIIGVVDLVDVHTECRLLDSSMATCSPWAEPHAYHLEFAHPRALATPIPYKGALGLRTLDAATEALIWEQVAK